MYIQIVKNFLFSFLRVVYIFQSRKNSKVLNFKSVKLRKYTKFKNIKNSWLKKYLKKNNKTKRFKKKIKLMALFYKKEVVCIGWMCTRNDWYISEIRKKIYKNNSIILFDFFTRPQFRNRGFYKKILTLIKNINTSKFFIIYSLSSNKKSINGILNAKFKLINKLRGINV